MSREKQSLPFSLPVAGNRVGQSDRKVNFFAPMLGLILLASFIGAMPYAKAQTEPEFPDWQAAARENSVAGYRAFLQLWPSSRFAAEANRRLSVLNAGADDTLWKSTLEKGTQDAYEAYLRQFPNGKNVANAARALAQMAAAQPLSAAVERGLMPKGEFRECVYCPVMVVVPSGQFLMGASDSEVSQRQSFPNEQPQHQVKIARPFGIGKYEVTFAEWDACVADGACRGYRAADGGWGRGSRPVFNVSWDDAKLYVKWLSQKTSKEYRLPSEAEWEYAARAGTSTRFYFGDDSKSLCKYANVADQSGSQSVRGQEGFGAWQLCDDGYFNTAPVGSFAPNQFGLYDMLGNVGEWVEDLWHENYRGAPGDGSAWLSGGNPQVRIARGGSYYHLEAGVRSAVRFNYQAGSQGNLVGFRVARTLRQ
jgi:formylglycine-generating enzyme required for sulfatase activity